MKAVLYGGFALTFFILFGLSLVNLGFIYKSITTINQFKNETKNEEFIDCSNKLENYISKINIATLAVPVALGFLLICIFYLYLCCSDKTKNIFMKNRRFWRKNRSSRDACSPVFGTITLAFSYLIGWFLITPILSIVYWYGYSIVYTCSIQIKSGVLDQVFNYFEGYYLICASACSIATLIVLIWIGALIMYKDRMKSLLDKNEKPETHEANEI